MKLIVAKVETKKFTARGYGKTDAEALGDLIYKLVTYGLLPLPSNTPVLYTETDSDTTAD